MGVTPSLTLATRQLPCHFAKRHSLNTVVRFKEYNTRIVKKKLLADVATHVAHQPTAVA